VARPLLLATAIAWLLAGIAALLLAAFGMERLEAMLPPLVIDTDALRGAIVAVGVGLVVVAGVHGAVILGLRARSRLAHTVAILMSALLTAMLIGLAAAAAAGAAADPSRATLFLLSGLGAAAGAAAYAVIAAGLVSERRAGSAI
jgi:hypothetical protein